MKWIKSLSAKVVSGVRQHHQQQHQQHQQQQQLSPTTADGSSSDRKSPHRPSLKRKAPLPSPDRSLDATVGDDAHARWRVGNILVDGPPSEAQWWGEESPVASRSHPLGDDDADDDNRDDDDDDDDTHHVMNGQVEACHIHSSAKGSSSLSTSPLMQRSSPSPLSPSTKVTTPTTKTPKTGGTSSSPSNNNNIHNPACFHNCGYDAWEQGRAAWRARIPPPPAETPMSPSSSLSSSSSSSLSSSLRQRMQTAMTSTTTTTTTTMTGKQYDKVVWEIRDGSRNFDLPCRMKLKEIIDIYAADWGIDSDPW